jgi:stage II sporulation protein D
MTLGAFAAAHAEDLSKDAVSRLIEIRERFDGPTIRIQLFDDVEGTQVEVKGRYNVFDPKTGKKADSAFLASNYYMYPTVDGIKWGAEFPGLYQVLIVPDKTETTVLVGGTEYRGMAYLYQIQGTLAAVNEVSLEDFVTSILSSHIPSYVTEKEAIAALAIALRSEALRQMTFSKSPYWDVKAGTFGYRGFSIERHDAPFIDAMRSSKAMVLMKGDDVVNVKWFAAGEAMAPFHEIQNWAKDGYDARAILEKLFPDSKIVLLSNFRK